MVTMPTVKKEKEMILTSMYQNQELAIFLLENFPPLYDN